MGAICCLGRNLEQCMDAMFHAPVKPAPPLAFTTDHPVSYPVFNLPGDLPQTLEKQHVEQQGIQLSLTARMAIAAARQALEDAGYSIGDLKGKKVGVCMGTTVGSSLNNDPFYERYRTGEQPEMDPVIKFLNSNPAQVVANAFGLTGPVLTVVNACASGADAIGTAREWINAGLCDIAIAGGSDELCKVTYNGFISLMITDPTPCRPFDATRSGLNLGEGAAAVVLEATSKNPVKGWLSGYGAACDAYHLTKPRPDARGLMSALDQVLSPKTIDMADIGFINAHGTGTKDNDRMEMTVFKEKLSGIPFFSTKGYTGHTLGAAGALEAVFTLACLNRQEIPSSRGFATPDPDFDLSPVTAAQKFDKPAAISQSVAFGGTNAVLLFHRN